MTQKCRISDQTVRRWLSILEASYIIFLLHPYEKTLGKRLVKSSKLFFYDPGLACYLLEISEKELLTSPKRGGIFESLIISEIIKQFYTKGLEPSIYFWQDKEKHEIDCIVRRGSQLMAIEIKAGRTPNPSFFSGLAYWQSLQTTAKPKNYVVYAGDRKRISGYKDLISWQSLQNILGFIR